MAGQGRTLGILGGVLALGIAAAVWAVMSAGTVDPADGARGGAATSEAAAESAKGGGPAAARPKRQGSAAVFGEIRRSAGKAPVAGQEVLLSPERGEPWTVTTDALGGFRFDRVPHGEPFELSAAAKGCGTIRIPGIALDRNEQRNVGTLWLDPSVKVTVRVRSGTDAPVAGAVVEAFPVPNWVDWDWSKALAQIGLAPIPVAKAATDASGEAIFPVMAVGEWTFTARKDGFATTGARGVTLRSGEEPQPVTIHLMLGHPLDGRVLGPDRLPVPGALVLAGAVDSAWDQASAPMRARTTAGADGRYAFAALGSGAAQLWVARAGGVPMPAATVRVPLVPHYDIVLKGGGTLAGTVTEKETGRPVEGATVRATSWEMGEAHSGEAVTGAEGRYSLAMTAGAINQLTSEKEGLVQVREEPPAGRQRQAVLHEGATVVRDFRMERGARLTGVVTCDGAPLAGVRVLVHVGSPNEGYEQESATTGADGRYEFPSLSKGSLLVLAEKEGCYLPDAPENWWEAAQSPDAAPEFRVDIPESGEATKDLELRRGSAVSGTVVGPDGAPLAGVRVGAPGAGDAPPTGADGAFRLDGVTPGPAVMLSCEKPGFVAATAKPWPVLAGEAAGGVELRMLREPRVRGRVTAASGAALRDARVLVAVRQATDDESPWTERWRWQNATRVPVRTDGTYDGPVPFAAGGKLLVRALALDQEETEASPVDLVEGQESYEVSLVLGDGADLAGRVSAKGGAAVAGADVSIAAHHESSDSGGVIWGGGGTPPVWAVTDDAGAFRVPHLAPGRYDVHVEAPGFVTAQVVVELGGGTPAAIELAPELSIEGIVAFADGRPAEGLEVTAGGGEDAPRTFDGVMRESPSATTDAKGAFRVTGLAEGRYTLEVDVPWGAEINARPKKVEDVAAGARDVRLTVDEGGRIAGRVMDAKRRPVPSAWISASPMPRDDGTAQDGGWRSVQSRPDGTFVLLGLTEGPYAIQVGAQSGAGGGFRPAHLKDVAVGTKDLEVVLAEGLSISGVVVGPDDKPIVQMVLMGRPADRGDEHHDQSSAYTDQHGRFTMSGLAPGAYRIETASWGGSNQAWVIDAKDPIEAGASGVRLVASRGATIAGVVVDEQGRPLGGVGVSAHDGKGGGWRSAQSKDDGAFEIVGLPRGGPYALRAEAEGRAPASVQDVEAGATGVKLVLAKGEESTGRLVDAAGRPMANAAIHLTHPDGKHQQSAHTDAEGRFKADGLVPGTYEAKAWVPKSDGSGEWTACGSVKAGEAGVELRVAK